MKLLNSLFFAFLLAYSLCADNALKSEEDDETLANIDSSSQFENSPGMGRGGFSRGSITRRGPYGGGGWFGGFVNPMNWPIYPGQPLPIATPSALPSAPSAPDDPDIEAEKKKVQKLQYLLDQKKLLQQLRDLDKDGGASPPSSSPVP